MSNQDTTTIDGWPFAQRLGVLVQSSYRTVPRVPGPAPKPRPKIGHEGKPGERTYGPTVRR